MAVGAGLTWRERLPPWGFLASLCVFLTALGSHWLPERTISVDFICYYTSARLLASGHSPYDLGAEIETQQALGWDRTRDGFGRYDCLPYFYPPWFGLACTAFLPLGYHAGKIAFFGLNIGLALSSGYLLRDTAKAAPRWAAPVLLPFFVFSVVCVLLAQTSLIVLFLVVLAWMLLDRGHDCWAGVALAWLTIKPQLTAVLLFGVLLWAIRQRRWGVIGAFLITSAFLAAIATAIVPSWPFQMLDAPRQIPPPTELYPWIGNTWFLLLRTLGAQTWGLWLLYLALAVPFLIAVTTAALDPTRPVADVLGAGLLAAFFVSPYARHYDFTVLVVPCLVLVGTRLSRVAGTALLLALVLVPYIQFIILARLKEAYHPRENFLYECSFLWIPPLLTVAWFARGKSRAKSPVFKAA